MSVLSEWLSYWDVVLAGLGVLAIGGGAVLASQAIARAQQSGRRRRLLIELFNQGNVRTPYAVWLEAPFSPVTFSLRTEAGPAIVIPPAAAPQAPAGRSAPRGGGLRRLGESLSQILGVASRWLPGAVGQEARMLDRNVRQANYLAREASYLGSMAAGPGRSESPARAAASEPVRLLTAPVEPGASVVIELGALPPAGPEALVSSFRVCSQAADAAAAPLDAQPAQVIFPPVSWLARLGPPLALAIVALAGMAACLFYVFNALGMTF